MARNSFAGRVLAAIKSFGADHPGVRAADLIEPLNIQTRKEAKKVSIALGDHYRARRLVKIEAGLYRMPRGDENRAICPVAPLIRDKVWQILRMRGTVSVADLQELAGASKNSAKKYLQLLVKRGIVKELKQPGNKPWKYQLVKRDIITPPIDDKTADRLKALRARKKAAAIKALEGVIELLQEED